MELSFSIDFFVLLIHSFRLFSITPLQVHYYSEAFLTQHGCCVRANTPKRRRQLRVKDLPKVPTWWLERDSNPRPFGRKASYQPMSRHAPQRPV